MRRSLLALTLGLTATGALVLAAVPNEQKVKRTFLLRSTPKPADPDPATQTEAQRTATLRKRMAEAKGLFDQGDVNKCLSEYFDPFWFARAATSSDGSVDDLLDKQILADKERSLFFAKRFSKTIGTNLQGKPRWLLNGRVASFITERGSSHTAEFWIYMEGKWRISPET